jgi:hypothetical protein
LVVGVFGLHPLVSLLGRNGKSSFVLDVNGIRQGLAAWSYVWKCPWIHPDRHLGAVRRYAALQDVLWAAFAAVNADRIVTEGSHKQARAHPALAEIRALSTESRLLEIELGLTPASTSKAGATRQRATEPDGVRDMHPSRRRAAVDDGPDPDDPRAGLRVIRT